jgi:hypothetical protein
VLGARGAGEELQVPCSNQKQTRSLMMAMTRSAADDDASLPLHDDDDLPEAFDDDVIELLPFETNTPD